MGDGQAGRSLTRQGLVSQGQAPPLLLRPGTAVLQGLGHSLALKHSGLQGLLLHSAAVRVKQLELRPSHEVPRVVKANDPPESHFQNKSMLVKDSCYI